MRIMGTHTPDADWETLLALNGHFGNVFKSKVYALTMSILFEVSVPDLSSNSSLGQRSEQALKP